MNKKQIYAVGLSLFALFLVAPHALADRTQYGDFSWRGNSHTQEAIEDLDEDIVEDIRIPVLFGVAVKNLTKNFGDPRSGHTHAGLDIMALEGTPVVSPTDAVVLNVGFDSGSGNYASVAAPGAESFVFMHLRDVPVVEEGDVLKPGDLIGYVGHTGNAVAEAPHLHFEIHDEDGVAIDPFPRLTAIFSLADKMEYLDEILDDADDEEALVEFLVTKFSSDFATAKASDIDLPDDVAAVLAERPALALPVAVPPSGLLRVGSRGSAVMALQTYLVKKNVGSASRVVADGVFGSITRQALIDYQASVGLTPDGVYGPQSNAYVLAHS